MSGRERVDGDILAHLEFYKELGVSYVGRPGNASACGSPAAKAPTGSGEATPPPGRTLFRMQEPGLFEEEGRSTPPESLESIKADLGDCRRCKLAPGRKNIVFGSGNPKAELMFVGEAPGAEEDDQGLPFVGRAGQLLTKIIESIGLRREEVYICNILKCRPPENRNPEGDEIASCEPFLFRQVAAVQPKVICALGTFAAQTVLRTKEAVGRLRGQFFLYRGVQLMVTFHPAYLLRNPGEKRKVWEDVQKIRDYLRPLRTR
jgi:uracil-DNA glycosylase